MEPAAALALSETSWLVRQNSAAPESDCQACGKGLPWPKQQQLVMHDLQHAMLVQSLHFIWCEQNVCLTLIL